MKLEESFGWIVIALAGLVGYKMLENKTTNPLTGAAAAIFGNDAVQGKYGAQAGQYFYNTNLTAGYNPADYTTYDARYADGSKNIADVFYNTPTLNVSKTDAAFAKIGLSTAQIEYINNHYGFAVGKSIVIKLSNGMTANLTATESAALAAVGWSMPAAAVYYQTTTFDERMSILNLHGAR